MSVSGDESLEKQDSMRWVGWHGVLGSVCFTRTKPHNGSREYWMLSIIRSIDVRFV